MPEPSSNPLVNPFEQPGQWHKANLHTHTTTSDGDSSVEERVKQYREHGYSVLAITDHEVTNDVSGLSTDDFLVLGGIEMHEPCEDGSMYHLVCLNVPFGEDLGKGSDPNTRVSLLRELGGEAIYCHPYWCGQNIKHLLSVEGYIGVEVYNATCTKIGKGVSSVHWDDLLDSGRMVPAFAVDDTHRDRDIFMGWTMIKAPDLSVDSVLSALRTGCCYASSGPVVEDFRIRDGKAVVKCSPAAEVHFMSRRASGCSFYADDGDPLTYAEFALPEGLGHVRCEVVDGEGRRAWTNPLLV